MWAIELSLSNQLEKDTGQTLIRPYHETILNVDYIYRRLVNKVLHETGDWDQDNVISNFQEQIDGKIQQVKAKISADSWKI